MGGERSHSLSPISSPLQVFARSPTSGLHLGPNPFSKLQKGEQIQRRAGLISLPTDLWASGPDVFWSLGDENEKSMVAPWLQTCGTAMQDADAVASLRMRMSSLWQKWRNAAVSHSATSSPSHCNLNHPELVWNINIHMKSNLSLQSLLLCFGFLTLSGCCWDGRSGAWSSKQGDILTHHRCFVTERAAASRLIPYSWRSHPETRVPSSACVHAPHFYSAPQRSKRGRVCQKLITRKHHYVNSCGEKCEQTMDGDKHKPRKEKIDCVCEVSDGWWIMYVSQRQFVKLN